MVTASDILEPSINVGYDCELPQLPTLYHCAGKSAVRKFRSALQSFLANLCECDYENYILAADDDPVQTMEARSKDQTLSSIQ